MDLERAYRHGVIDKRTYCKLLAFYGGESLNNLEREMLKEFSTEIAESAALGGRTDVLDWLSRNAGLETKENMVAAMKKAMVLAAQMGNIEVLYCGQYYLSSECFERAVSGSTIGVMEWLKSHNCPWDGNCYSAAIYPFDVNKLNWLHKNGCPWTENLEMLSLLHKNLGALQWLRGHDYKFSETFKLIVHYSKDEAITKWAENVGLTNKSVLDMLIDSLKDHADNNKSV